MMTALHPKAAPWLGALAALAGLATALPAAAQTKTGTTIGAFLLIEPSARITGMGNAGVTTDAGLHSVYYNPAAIGHLDRYAVLFTHSEWLADIDYNYAAAALPQNLWERLEKLAREEGNTRLAMLSAWGSTETAPLATSVHWPIDRAGVIGLPVAGCELILEALVAERRISRSDAGRYGRAPRRTPPGGLKPPSFEV